MARELLAARVATLIWIVLAIAWGWHVVELFRRIDPAKLPTRARRRFGQPDGAEPVRLPLRLVYAKRR